MNHFEDPKVNPNSPLAYLPFTPLNQCPLFNTLLEGSTPDKCRYVFNHEILIYNVVSLFHNNYQQANLNIRALIALFIISIRHSDYDYAQLSQEENEFVTIVDEVFTQANTHNFAANSLEGTAAIIEQQKAYYLENLPSCEIPVSTIIDFINSKHSEIAITKIKANPTIWQAYDATITDVSLPLEQVKIGALDFGLLAVEACFQQMEFELQKVLDPYNLSLDTCDILEISFAIKYGSDALLTRKCSFSSCHEKRYSSIKRGFHLCTGLDKTATESIVNKINSILPGAAAIINNTQPTIRVSYYFMQQHFIPEFAEFLKNNPLLIALMTPSSTTTTQTTRKLRRLSF